jgi:PAS domain S-box-containing protein
MTNDKNSLKDSGSGGESFIESELNFRSLFTAMTEGVAIHQMIYNEDGIAIDYIIREVNPSFEKNLGIPAHKAKSEFASKLYGVNPPPYIDIYKHVLKTGDPYFFTTYFQPLDRYFEISVFTPKENYFATVILDVTGSKRAAEELRSIGNKYRRLYESMMDGFVRTDMQGNIREFNSCFREMLGYSESELLKFNYLDFTPESWQEYEKRIIHNQVIPNGYSTVYEKEYRKKDGSIIPVELRVSLIKDERGMPDGMWEVVRDITDRKNAERELEQMIDRFNLATFSGNMGVWEWDVRTHQQIWDDKMLELFDVEREEFEDTPDFWEKCVHPDDFPRIQEEIKKALSGEKEYNCEYRIVHKNGETFYIKAFAQVVRDSVGSPQRFTGINYDITSRILMENEIREMNFMLENKVEQKTRELQERVRELERFYKATIDRELRMKEMRTRIQELEAELKKRTNNSG